MYNADSTLLERLNRKTQVKSANNDPRLQVYITRNKTAITSQRYWERQLITGTVGTRSSIAVRRPEGSLLGDMIFTAQVEGGDAIIRYATPKTKLADMEWEVQATLPNVSELSIMFDGYMKKVDDKVEAYTVGELPWVFYVDASNSLKYINLDGEEQGTISDDAVNVASVRGLYSETANLDDGIWVFYTNTLGELWEARVQGGEVQEVTQITLLPDGVTGWEDCWVGLTFDYRIILQLKGNDGKVYTLVSKSRPGGYSNLEYLQVSKVKVTGEIGLEEPHFLYAEQVPVGDNWGKQIKVVFDKDLFNIGSAHTEFRLLEESYGTYVHPTAVTYGETHKELHLNFEDYNQIVIPATLEFIGGMLSGIDLPVEPFTAPANLKNLNRHGGYEYLELTSVEVTGELAMGFDGKGYMSECLELSSVAVAGENVEVAFEQGYMTEYLELTSVAVAGTYADASGVPIG